MTALSTARRAAVAVGVAAALLACAPTAWAAGEVNTVNWTPDSAADGTGSGTLLSGSSSVGVTYSTSSFAGTAFPTNWNTSLATNGAVGTGATFLTAVALGVSTTGGETQTVTFSQNVVDPIIYVAFADLGMLLDFGAIPVTLLDNNNGTLLAGHTVHFGVLATDSVNDGFAARLTGTFGPGAPLQFLIDASTPQSSVAFTLGLPANVNAAPVCTDVSATGTSEQPTVVPLSCSDADGDALTYSVVTPPPAAQGTVTVSGANATFTPAEDFEGTVTFTYRATDPSGAMSAPQTVTITVALTCGGRTPTVRGTTGNNVLSGTGGNDVIVGLGGNDTIDAGSGDDRVCGGSGHDEIEVGSGNDRVFAGSGNDSVRGGSGDDTVFGGAGNDLLDGGGDRDRLFGEAGIDQLFGGGDPDQLDGGADTPDRCDGEGGADTATACEQTVSVP